MINISIKRFMLVIFFAVISHAVFAQGFFSDYKEHLLSRMNYKGDTNKRIAAASVTRLQKALDKYKAKTGYNFLTADTIYFINGFLNMSGYSYKILWTKKRSCYFGYIYPKHPWTIVRNQFTVKTHASDYLQHTRDDIIHWIRTADTVSYSAYCKEHSVEDGSDWSFTRAVKMNNHWTFISSNSYTADFTKRQ